MRHDYVELNRNFLDFEDELDVEGAAWKSYYASLSGGLDWRKLLQSQYVVILGEAGSGKTWELEAQAEKLRKVGLKSFFIRLETLANQSFSVALDANDLEDFSKWQSGSTAGTFFLDSVDEAKLQRPQAFHDALNSFVKGIDPRAFNRAHVVITCRVSEWRGKADLHELRHRFAISEGQVRKKSYSRTEDPPPLLRVVQLAPLDRERVSLFASHHGVKDTEVFIKAIDLADLWNFAGRPKDVENLITYWHENKSFGNISQMVEYDVKCKLRETDRMTPLSLDQAMYGAQALASAAILCRRFTFVVPDEPVDPVLAAAAIDPMEVLTDWKSEHIRALLSMAVFDEAAYGRVRFHHRTIAEYLAAKWILYSQTAGCPLRSIEDIIFGQAHGREVVRPSCIPIAAWLSILDWPWSKIILDRVIRINPDILLSYGDPQLLPLEARHSILESMVKRYEGRRRVRVDTDTAQLRRLAHDNLAPEINVYLMDKTISVDIRELFLRMIRNGKLSACIDAALRIIADETENESLRYDAVLAVVENASDAQLRQLVTVVADYKEISQRICAILLQTLYPKIIGVREVINLIDKVILVSRLSVNYLPDALNNLMSNTAPNEHLPDILSQFIMLIEQRPRIQFEGKETPISSRFLWLGHALYSVVHRLLTLPPLNEQTIADLARAIFLLENIKKFDMYYRQQKFDLQKESESHPAVRRAYFWERVSTLRTQKKEAELDAYSVFGYTSVLRLSEADRYWLVEDIYGDKPDNDKELSLKLALRLWRELGKPKALQVTLEKVIEDKPNLQKILRQYIPNLPHMIMGEIKNRIYRFQHIDRYEIRWKLRKMINRLYEKWRNLYNYLWCLTHIRGIRSGKYTWTLYWLASYFKSDRTVSTTSVESWQDLVSDFGLKVANAARDGWKSSWRKFQPLFPHERTDQSRTNIRVVIGIKGIEADIADGLQIKELTGDEATLAAIYALYEWNTFPNWFISLACSHPEQIRAVLNRCIEAEWLAPPEMEHVSGILSSLPYNEAVFRDLVSPRLMDLIRGGEPAHKDVLRQALGLLLSSNNVYSGEIAALASQRIRNYRSEDERFIIWLLTWLNIDGNSALNFLEQYLQDYAEVGDRLIETLGTVLCSYSKYQHVSVESPSYKDVNCLRRLIVLFYKHVRPTEDLDRSEGFFTPTARDDAQTCRSALLEMLFRSQDRSAFSQIQALLNEPLLFMYRDYLLRLLDERSAIDADGATWQPGDVPVFAREYEVMVRSADALFRILCNRLDDIRNLIERGDFSLRKQFKPDDPEETLQKWFADRLTNIARDKYGVVREAEVDQGKKPDIVIFATGVERLPIEIKWAHKWSLEELKYALTEQLIGQYMREEASRHGFFVICNADPARQWELTRGERIVFSKLIECLRGQADDILNSRNDLDGLVVMGIDFTNP